MENKTRVKEFALIYLVAIILLLGTVAFVNLGKSGMLSITGAAVAGNESNETQLGEDIKVIDLSERLDAVNETSTINETTETAQTNEAIVNETEEKGKPDKRGT